ncbi:Hypothetical protein NTJ_04151 [Nesidiocoris tenuis]|uniref:Uncharacterized protein n=1 Tax=Nesidiocoris tenuis TaxID=355587 RepID=A0ABN7AHB9_9HEMI|nr:Hypothetical protein NTJ_04151 [Nesidiocoris tenuis]
MALNTRFRTVALVSSISSLVQGVTLCVLAILGFLSYSCHLKVEVPSSIQELTFKHYLAAYFQGSSCQESLSRLYPEIDSLTSSQKLLLLNIFVFVFNFFICIASSVLMFALWTEKKHLAFGWTLFYVMMCYSVALVDLVAVSIIALDYGIVEGSKDSVNKGIAMLSLLTLIFIAARGFYIWVANVAFTIYLSTCLCRDAGCGKQKQSERKNSVVPSFKNAVQCPHCDPTPIYQTGWVKNVDSPSTNDRTAGDHLQQRTGGAVKYPSHSAFARWPQLTENGNNGNHGNPTRPHSFPGQFVAVPVPAVPPLSHRYPRQQGRQSASESARTSFREETSNRLDPRPGSLEEAIKTVRPLRRVNRPPIY